MTPRPMPNLQDEPAQPSKATGAWKGMLAGMALVLWGAGVDAAPADNWYVRVGFGVMALAFGYRLGVLAGRRQERKGGKRKEEKD